MHTSDSDLRLPTYYNDYNISYIKKTKMRSIVMLVMTVAACFALSSLTEAKAFTTPEPVSSTTSDDSSSPLPSERTFNESRLVITHVLKTVEFQVDLINDDDDDDNNTETTTAFIETEIKLLNPTLLKQIVDLASNNSHSSTEPPMSSEEDAVTES